MTRGGQQPSSERCRRRELGVLALEEEAREGMLVSLWVWLLPKVLVVVATVVELVPCAVPVHPAELPKCGH